MNGIELPALWAICCAVAAWQARPQLWALFALPVLALAFALWLFQKFLDTRPDPFGVINLLRLGAVWSLFVVAVTFIGLRLRQKRLSVAPTGTGIVQGL